MKNTCKFFSGNRKNSTRFLVFTPREPVFPLNDYAKYLEQTSRKSAAKEIIYVLTTLSRWVSLKAFRTSMLASSNGKVHLMSKVDWFSQGDIPQYSVGCFQNENT